MIQIEMEMPASCGRCKLSAQRQMSLGGALKCMVIGGDVGCSYDDKHDVLNKRRPNCPLHEVTADTDTISRQDAIDAIKKACNGCDDDDYGVILCNAVIKVIKALPPSPSRPHDISKAKFSCPICGAEMEVTVDEWDEGSTV